MKKSEILKNLKIIINDCPFLSEKTWQELTTLGVGTGSPIITYPRNNIQLQKILAFANNHNLEIFPVGNGSNIIGSDQNSDNFLVIKLSSQEFQKVSILDNYYVKTGAGKSLYSLFSHCSNHELGGAEPLAGIPATIAGAVKNNAGRCGISISDFINEIKGFRKDGSSCILKRNDINFDYRYSNLPADLIITEIILKLEYQYPDHSRKKIKDNIKKRNSLYPFKKNAGCIFKNPKSGHGAGKLIDISGCKGLKENNLQVSSAHANFITCNNFGTEKDFFNLAVRIKQKVFNKTGIYLEPEVDFINKNSAESFENMPERKSVSVLMGGNSHEREVSLKSGHGVAKALEQAGYYVNIYDIKTPTIPKSAQSSDIIFPLLHGGFGENGKIQKEMEKFHLNFVGCKSKASQVGMDKVATKHLFQKLEVNTPNFAVIDKNEKNEFPSNLSLPVVVKPADEGSTLGISLVKEKKDWYYALHKASKYSSKNILIEEYIEGYEVTAGLLEGNCLPLIYIQSPGKFYDYDAKYYHYKGETLYFFPSETEVIDKYLEESITGTSEKIYSALNARHMLRVDLLISQKDKKPYYLEVNTIPGFTSQSLLPKAAAKKDIPYIQLCTTLAKSALK